MLKSAFKDPSREPQSHRQVSFCSTIEVYSYPPDLSLAGCGDELQSLENPNEEVTVERREVHDDDLFENPEDFRVHKVVYSNFEDLFPGTTLQDFDSDEGEPVVYYPTETETELQEFVVHCVNKLEKEKNKSHFQNDGSVTPSGTGEKVCELSIENIQQHNKLTEHEIHIDSCLEGVSFSSDVNLSPPLRDLGINHLICPKSDQWFWELDISPLNSTQETDSGSNLSEDTMIMMTSEECEKNEKRIQESLQKFQSLKSLKSPGRTSNREVQQKCDGDSETSIVPSLPTNQDIDDLEMSTLSLESSGPKNRVVIPSNSESSCQAEPDEKSHSEDKEVLDFVASADETADASHAGNISLDDSLSSVEIPDDVREWKIETMETKVISAVEESRDAPCDSLKCSESPELREPDANISLPDCKQDELENFVNECTERIERIKKRYSINEKSLWTPRRGIRPRFGSTVQILQQMQIAKTSSVPNSHYSWPCYSPSGSDMEDPYLLNSFYPSLVPRDLCDRTEGLSLRSASCDSKRSSSPAFSERGVPEGFSPPLAPALETKNQNETVASDSVIYYSMKV